jgi:Domain of unknown function (DUF3846)
MTNEMEDINMSKKIRVVTLKADSKELVVNENFEHSLENMQEAVGGGIEAITGEYFNETGREITIWLNGEGKLKGLQPNFAILKTGTNRLLDIVVGDVLITAIDEEGSTVGLTDDELKVVQGMFEIQEREVYLNPTIIVQKSIYM